MDKNMLKVVVPLVMVAIIVGIWFTQNQTPEAGNEAQGTQEAETEAQGTQEAEQGDQEESAGADDEIPLNITNIDLEVLAEYNQPIIIDFGADECVPCKEMAPVLATLNKEMQGEAIIQFVDVWKAPTAATGFPVQVIPTQVLINSDSTPYVPSDEVASEIQFTMYADSETEEHIFTTHQGGLTEEQMRLILADMGVE